MFELSLGPSNEKLQGALSRWEKSLHRADPTELPMFVDAHQSELQRIAMTLRKIANSNIRGYHDRIFGKLLGMQKRLPSHLTTMFYRFVQGITYFQHQMPNDTIIPIYHRLFACGPGDDAFRRTLNQQHRADVRARIETCYIERLIYDHMYRHLALHFPETGASEKTQDAGHLFRLDLTKRDFETCFPNLRLEVDIRYDDMGWPIQLILQRFVRDRLVSTETHQRTIYFNPIFGTKSYEDAIDAMRQTDRYAYFRVQRFAFRPAWRKLGAAPAPL